MSAGGANPTENGSVMEMEDIVIRKITASQQAGSSPAWAMYLLSYHSREPMSIDSLRFA